MPLLAKRVDCYTEHGIFARRLFFLKRVLSLDISKQYYKKLLTIGQSVCAGLCYCVYMPIIMKSGSTGPKPTARAKPHG